MSVSSEFAWCADRGPDRRRALTAGKAGALHACARSPQPTGFSTTDEAPLCKNRGDEWACVAEQVRRACGAGDCSLRNSVAYGTTVYLQGKSVKILLHTCSSGETYIRSAYDNIGKLGVGRPLRQVVACTLVCVCEVGHASTPEEAGSLRGAKK